MKTTTEKLADALRELTQAHENDRIEVIAYNDTQPVFDRAAAALAAYDAETERAPTLAAALRYCIVSPSPMSPDAERVALAALAAYESAAVQS